MLKLDRDQLVETLARAQAEIRVLKASRDGYVWCTYIDVCVYMYVCLSLSACLHT